MLKAQLIQERLDNLSLLKAASQGRDYASFSTGEMFPVGGINKELLLQSLKHRILWILIELNRDLGPKVIG